MGEFLLLKEDFLKKVFVNYDSIDFKLQIFRSRTCKILTIDNFTLYQLLTMHLIHLAKPKYDKMSLVNLLKELDGLDFYIDQKTGQVFIPEPLLPLYKRAFILRYPPMHFNPLNYIIVALFLFGILKDK